MMERRDVLNSVAGIATVSTVALAGCGSGSGADETTESDESGGSTTADMDSDEEMTTTEEMDSDGGMTTAEDSDGGMSVACAQPSGDLEEVVPDTETYSPTTDPTASSAGEGVETSVTGLYMVDGSRLTFTITKYSARPTVTETSGEQTTAQRETDTVVGYIRAGDYTYSVTGPDEETVRDLLTASPALDADCVDENAEFN